MIDAERQEAEAIISLLEAELKEARRQLGDRQSQGPPNGPPGTISNSRLCLGCYLWRLIVAMISGGALGALAWALCDMTFGNADFAQFGIIAGASLVPLGVIALDWKIRLYKNGHPGVLRFMANVLAEGKRGLRYGQ
jgi:hypothetical protein